jgi:TolB-like protein/Tfp pilus assembly protein PilF
MSAGSTGPEASTAPAPAERLESWKSVAAYLKRDISTVQRWEQREGLPVHRQQHDKLGSVFAFKHELDAWRDARTRRGESPTPTPEATAEPALREPAGAPAPIQDQTPRHAVGAGRRLAGLVVAGAAVLALVLAPWWIARSADTGAAQPRPAIGAIVVLPIENLSGDPAQDVVAAGLTEEITARLAQLRSVRVVSRTSAMSLARRQMSVAAIATELDVDAIIEGSLRQERDRVRIAIQLVHVPTDTHIWARNFDRAGGATIDMQIEVAEAVVSELGATETPDERARRAALPRGSSEAHREYLLGRHLLWKFIEADRVLAIAHFHRAIGLDPNYAAPHAALAHAWWMRGVFGPLALKEVASPARDAALASLARDDRNAEALAALAYVQGMFDWDWPAAQQTIERAIDIEPNRLDARYVHALLLMATGRLPDAVAEMEVAARLDPLSAQVQSTFGRVLQRAGRLDEAEGRLRRALELEPRNVGTYTRLAQVLAHRGDITGAIGLLDQAESMHGSTSSAILVARARTSALAGRAGEARRLLQGITDGPGRAEVLAILGDRDAAFAELGRSLDSKNWLLFIKGDPIFAGLHEDPRWAAVLRRMRLAD